MLIDSQVFFKIAAGLYGMSLGAALFFRRRQRVLLFFLLPSLLANTMALALRYWTAWPMLPMYAVPLAVPLFMGVAAACGGLSSQNDTSALRGILTLMVLIALAGVVFPKDYYMPFIKSQTAWAHLFFGFGAAGRGCFFIAAAWAMAGLKGRDAEKGRCGEKKSSPPSNVSSFSRAMQWVVWGFGLWTLSMFAGELWSCLGWGTPVIWDDPAIMAMMATWFFYICLLHLHLTGSWTVRGRRVYAGAGALVVFGLNCAPELGPMRWPW